MISVMSQVPQYDCVPVIAVNRDIHETIIVKVAECSTARCNRCRKNGATPVRYVGESALLVLEQQGRFEMAKSRFSEFDIIHHVSLRYEKVKPPVVVVVNPFGTPTGMRHGQSSHTN